MKFGQRFTSKDLLVLAIASLIQLAISFLGSMIQVALPLMSKELNLTIEFANWITISYMVAFIAVSIPLSRVISQYDIKKITIYGIVILIIGLTMSIFSPNIYFILLSRVIQGISAAILLITIYMFIVNQVSNDNIGSGLGIVGACGYLGMSIAPTLSGFIVYYLSWRMLFIILVIVFIICLILLLKLDSEWKSDQNPINKTSSFFTLL